MYVYKRLIMNNSLNQNWSLITQKKVIPNNFQKNLGIKYKAQSRPGNPGILQKSRLGMKFLRMLDGPDANISGS